MSQIMIYKFVPEVYTALRYEVVGNSLIVYFDKDSPYANLSWTINELMYDSLVFCLDMQLGSTLLSSRNRIIIRGEIMLLTQINKIRDKLVVEAMHNS